MQVPLVSIIIPTYNYGKYICKAIESALHQTYSNIEVLVIDDGSTDETEEILKMNSYPIKYYWQKHSGVAKAMNTGIKLSKGKYFVCLGADDKLHPDFIKQTVKEIEKDPKIGFVCTGSFICDETMHVVNVLIPRKIFCKYDILTVGWVGALGSALIRRKAYDSLDYGYDSRLPAHEDVDLCFRLCQKKWKFKQLFECLHYYRFHVDSRNPKTIEKIKYTQSFLDKKYPLRKAYRIFYSYFIIPTCILKCLMRNPISYLWAIKKKIKNKVMVRSYNWINSFNKRLAEDLLKEIALLTDLIVNFKKNKQLNTFYLKKLKCLEEKLSELFITDSKNRRLSS